MEIMKGLSLCMRRAWPCNRRSETRKASRPLWPIWGLSPRERGRYDEAEKLLGQSLLLNRELGDKLRIGVDLNNLGFVATLQCKYENALAYHEEAVQQYRDLDNKLGISDSLMNLGTVAKDRGDFRQSEALFTECLALKKELGDRRGMSRTTVRLATSALLQGGFLDEGGSWQIRAWSLSRNWALNEASLAPYESARWSLSTKGIMIALTGSQKRVFPWPGNWRRFTKLLWLK